MNSLRLLCIQKTRESPKPAPHIICAATSRVVHLLRVDQGGIKILYKSRYKLHGIIARFGTFPGLDGIVSNGVGNQNISPSMVRVMQDAILGGPVNALPVIRSQPSLADEPINKYRAQLEDRKSVV